MFLQVNLLTFAKLSYQIIKSNLLALKLIQEEDEVQFQANIDKVHSNLLAMYQNDYSTSISLIIY